MSGGTDRSQLGDGGPERGPEYAEQEDRLVVTTPFLRTAFSRVNGTVVSLLHRETSTELVDSEEARSQGFLWRIEIRSADGHAAEATNAHCGDFCYSFGRHRHEGTLRLWLQWHRIVEGVAPTESALTVCVSFPGDASSMVFEHEVELPTGYSVAALELPCLSAVGCPERLANDGVFLPLSGGIYLPKPSARSPESRIWKLEYPAPASMQILGYCCGERTALWLSPRDATGARKSLTVSGMPSSDRLRLSVTQLPTLRSDEHWSSGYPVAIGIATGDWFEAALEYRAWAARQHWASRGRGGERRVPPLTSAYGLWASYWGGARRVAGIARELQRHVNVPVKLDWRCWHASARGSAYPAPRDGEEAFAAAEKQLGDSGVLDQLNLSALPVSRESSISGGEPGVEAYAPRPTEGPADASGRCAGSALEDMCPAGKCWREKVAGIATEIAKRGADGVYLEELGASPVDCDDLNHGHGPATPDQWSGAIRSLLGAVRGAIGPSRQMASDCLAESHLDLVDAVFTNHAAAERDGLVPSEFGPGWVPIPLYAAVYHDYTTIVGPSSALSGRRQGDPMPLAGRESQAREPPEAQGRESQAQFCLGVARSVAWGYQPILEGFAPEQLRDEANRHKLAFLAAALRAQAWGIGALLPQSRFLGLLAIDCPTLETGLLVGRPHGAAAERQVRRRSLPSVYGSAWRVPGGGLALVLVNIDTREVGFTAKLRSTRLALQLPLRLIGRTFSEDGDVPAASLRASGSEVTGRLPARAIVLVSVR